MPDIIEAVNELAVSFRTIRDRPELSAPVRQIWANRLETVEAALAELRRLTAWAKPLPASYGDTTDLPPELLAQLTGAKTDDLEDQIYAVVKAAGDQIELDRLLIELYRRHGTVHERRFLNNKCYRMAQKGLIHVVKGKKGVYTTLAQTSAALDFNDAEPQADGGFKRQTLREALPVTPDDDDEIPF